MHDSPDIYLNAARAGIDFALTTDQTDQINMSLGLGEFGRTGWLAYPPLSGIEASPGVGVDYWILNS